MDRFDYIIAGGGSSGCVLANRLSADPNTKVLLIEAGRRDTNPWIHIPATFFKVMEAGRDLFFYRGEPEAGTNGRGQYIPQGKVLGGGSSVNGMVYIRGSATDYDGWAQMGLRNWSYERVLDAFRAVERNQRLSDAFHGQEGELGVSDRRYGHPLSWAFIRAAQEVGLPYNADFNGKAQEGVGFYQTTTSEGRRSSAAAAFLRPAEKRGNLRIITGAFVARVLFDGKRATGVELVDGRRFGADGEVILTAGALASPKILQLSGVGNAEELAAHGIEVVADLPGVGENFQDHLEVPVQGETRDPISFLGQDRGVKAAGHMVEYLLGRRGVLSSTVVESGGFADTTGAGEPDIQFHVLPVLAGFVDREPEPGHGIAINPCCLQPRSRGTVKLRSADPNDPILFHPNSFSDASDLDTLVRGVELSIRILEAPSLAKLLKRRLLPKPGVEQDREALKDFVRGHAKTAFHPSGTCKMGTKDDRMAVVGEDLKVRGLEGLRVCDISIMPKLVSGNTNAPAIMIGERASRFILGHEALV